MQKLDVHTHRRVELVDITAQVQQAVSRAGTRSGAAVVFCPHTTAALTLNENADPAVRADISRALERLFPAGADYTHGEGNADSHIKSSLFGNTLTLIVDEGKVVLGTWQGVYLCESDGPRRREVWVRVLKE